MLCFLVDKLGYQAEEREGLDRCFLHVELDNSQFGSIHYNGIFLGRGAVCFLLIVYCFSCVCSSTEQLIVCLMFERREHFYSTC